MPSPCGANAMCRVQKNAGSCTCLPDYIGNPYESCRPECLYNTDCPSHLACVRNKCQDPCPGTCAPNADCRIVNHIPQCTCRSGFTGDPFTSCNVYIERKPFNHSLHSFSLEYNQPLTAIETTPIHPCRPSPCGPNSQCREINGQAVCSCLPNYNGSPPSCRPECVVTSECPSNKACLNQKCIDPCIGTCGINSKCEVINHSPICSCNPGHTGDPFTRCYHTPRKTEKNSHYNRK